MRSCELHTYAEFHLSSELGAPGRNIVTPDAKLESLKYCDTNT